VGAQGGSSEVCKYGMNANVGLLINSSRGIIYASAVLILQKKQEQKVENATGNGANFV
jgi:orotidine-5'-phosphate decarboxylase